MVPVQPDLADFPERDSWTTNEILVALTKELMPNLLRQVHSAQEGLKAWFGAQGLENRVKAGFGHAWIVHLDTFLKPCEGLSFFPGHRIQPRNVLRGHMSLACPRGQYVRRAPHRARVARLRVPLRQGFYG